MAESLLDSFSNLERDARDILADTTTPRTLAFLALYIAKSRFNVTSLSAEHIVAYLEAAGVAVTRLSIVRALASAEGFVTRRIGEGDEVFYTLMLRGDREAEKVLSTGGLAVLRIEAGQPRQARRKLGEILSTMDGDVMICDPFFGLRTLDALEMFPDTAVIRMLTRQNSDNDRVFSSAFNDLKRERPNIELRRYPKSLRAHDRYVVTKDDLLILGHGLKDIGGSESFVIQLDRSLTPDLIDELSTRFEANWQKAASL